MKHLRYWWELIQARHRAALAAALYHGDPSVYNRRRLDRALVDLRHVRDWRQ